MCVFTVILLLVVIKTKTDSVNKEKILLMEMMAENADLFFNYAVMKCINSVTDVYTWLLSHFYEVQFKLKVTLYKSKISYKWVFIHVR